MTQTGFLYRLHAEADRICEEIRSGRLSCGCSMSATNSPIREVWSATEDLLETVTLRPEEQEWLLNALHENTRAELARHEIDDFGLVYEYLQQLTLHLEDRT